MVASVEGHEDVVEYLVIKGADVGATTTVCRIHHYYYYYYYHHYPSLYE